MIHAPSAFLVNDRGLITDTPAFDWFAAGRGIAFRKWDGVPCLIARTDGDRSYTCYRGVVLEDGQTPPQKFLQSSDAGEVPIRGWAAVSKGDFEFQQAIARLVATGKPIEPGTYELCGPDIKGNHEGFEVATLVPHRLISYLRCPRDLTGLLYFLAATPIEGVVWQYDGRYCQLTRSDIGLPWPVGGEA